MPDFEAFDYAWMDELDNPRILSVFINKQNPDKDLIVNEFLKTIELPI